MTSPIIARCTATSCRLRRHCARSALGERSLEPSVHYPVTDIRGQCVNFVPHPEEVRQSEEKS